MANNGLAPLQPPEMHSILSPSLAKDIEDWLEAQAALEKAREEIKKLAAMIHTMKNPMLGIQQIMGDVMDMQGARIGTLSAVDNLDSDLRNEVTTGQGAVNSIGNGNSSNPTTEAQKLIDFYNNIEAFLKDPSAKEIADSADIKNLETALGQIKSQFGSSWGDAEKMGSQINGWVQNSNNGEGSPHLKSVLDGFQTLNQSTSALSTTTNTQLQYVSEQYKQFLGVYQNINQTWLKLAQNEVSNQRSA